MSPKSDPPTTSPRLSERIREASLGPPEKAEAPAAGWLKPDSPVWRRRYGLFEDFPAFQGHFEGRPVLPALAQTLLAKDAARSLCPGLDFIAAIVSAKFLGLVAPPALVTVYVQPPGPEPGPGLWRFQLTTARAGGPPMEAAALRLELR